MNIVPMLRIYVLLFLITPALKAADENCIRQIVSAVKPVIEITEPAVGLLFYEAAEPIPPEELLERLTQAGFKIYKRGATLYALESYWNSTHLKGAIVAHGEMPHLFLATLVDPNKETLLGGTRYTDFKRTDSLKYPGGIPIEEQFFEVRVKR